MDLWRWSSIWTLDGIISGSDYADATLLTACHGVHRWNLFWWAETGQRKACYPFCAESWTEGGIEVYYGNYDGTTRMGTWQEGDWVYRSDLFAKYFAVNHYESFVLHIHYIQSCFVWGVISQTGLYFCWVYGWYLWFCVEENYIRCPVEYVRP